MYQLLPITFILSLSVHLISAIPLLSWNTYTEDIITEPPLPRCVNPSKFENNWILQFSDHSSDLDPTVWRLRYFANFDHFEYGGAMFVIVGGPWEISPHFVCSGLVVDAARNTNGVVFYLEHRFYGQSHPAKFKSKDELSLLTRDQTIEDIRYFIEHQKAHSLGMAGSQVILIGSHLGGSLAAWTQLKYPLLVNGVWASGAPFTATDYLPGFLKSVRHFVHNAGGEKCLQALDDTFRIIKMEMEGVISPEYFDIYQMCSAFDFQNLYDQSTFLYRLSSAITRTVLFNDPSDIADNLCYELLDVQYLDAVEAYAPYFLSRRKPTLGGRRCLDFSFKKLLNDTANRNGRVDAWAYQSCSEYGWFPGGPDNFWLSRNFFQSLCYNAFSLLGEEREEAKEETNMLMEGIVNGTSNVVLSYGMVDPWTRAGITELGKDAGDRNVIFIKDISTRNTMMSSLNSTDSLDMQEAKMVILDKMEKWAAPPQKMSNFIISGCNWSQLSSLVLLVALITLKFN